MCKIKIYADDYGDVRKSGDVIIITLACYYLDGNIYIRIKYTFNNITTVKDVDIWDYFDSFVIDSITEEEFNFINARDDLSLIDIDKGSTAYNRVTQDIKNYLRNEKLKKLDL